MPGVLNLARIHHPQHMISIHWLLRASAKLHYLHWRIIFGHKAICSARNTRSACSSTAAQPPVDSLQPPNRRRRRIDLFHAGMLGNIFNESNNVDNFSFWTIPEATTIGKQITQPSQSQTRTHRSRVRSNASAGNQLATVSPIHVC